MAFLEIDGVHKRFRENEVLRGVDLDVDEHDVWLEVSELQ